MRAFVAVELNDEVRNKLANLQRDLPGEVRKVKPENLHITLQFLGEIDDAKVEQVKKALGSINTAPFEVQCRGIGAFPSEKFVRVVWAGAESTELEALYKQVHEALKPLGFIEDRFSAHITIGRPKTRVDLQPFLAKHAQTEFGSFKVERVVLMKSMLQPGGPNYEVVYEKRLG